MKNIKIYFVYILLYMILSFIISSTAFIFAQSAVHIKNAQDCNTMETGKKRIAQYKKLVDPFKDLYIGIIYHNIAANNNEAVLPKAMEFTKKAAEKTKAPLALGYYGSTLLIQSGQLYQKGDIMNCMTKLQEGVTLMDNAVTLAPKNMDLRVIRISNFLEISKDSPIKKFDTIKEDLDYLKQNYKSLLPQLKSFYHLYCGYISQYNRLPDEAMIQFEKSIQCSPQSDYAKRAKREIQRLEE